MNAPRSPHAEVDLTETVALRSSFTEINDYFYEHGWTDGLPVIPPTRELVTQMLSGMPWRSPDELVTTIPPKLGKATLRQIAVNAVMAGCKPEYLPVVVAAIEALSEPKYGLSHRQTTTHPGAPLMIVNGPIVQRLKINCGTGVFGPGWRANATIGRAVRLILINIGGAGPGVDFGQMGHPGRFTFCIAEHEAASPWEPLHVERGFAANQSTVTMVNCDAPHCMSENMQTDPNEIVRTFATTMNGLGINNLYSQGHPVIVLGIEHAAHIAAAGWSKRDLKMALFERARQPWGLIKNRGKSKGPVFPEWVNRNDDAATVPLVTHADEFIVIVAGGDGPKSAWLPTAGAHSLSVTKLIQEQP